MGRSNPAIPKSPQRRSLWKERYFVILGSKSCGSSQPPAQCFHRARYPEGLKGGVLGTVPPVPRQREKTGGGERKGRRKEGERRGGKEKPGKGAPPAQLVHLIKVLSQAGSFHLSCSAKLIDPHFPTRESAGG